jgi:hypothetical protein
VLKEGSYKETKWFQEMHAPLKELGFIEREDQIDMVDRMQ